MDRLKVSDELRRTGEEVLAQFHAPEGDLDKRYGPGKWSVREILVHLADCEIVFLWRVYRGVAEPGTPVYGFNQDAWANALHYATRPLGLARDLFAAARNQLVHVVETMPEAAARHSIHHSEAGIVTVSQLLEKCVKHTRHHLSQIEAARSGKSWSP